MPDDREAAYQRYVELSAPYVAAIEAAGNKPWWSSEDERRERFFRRWTKPKAPVL